MAEVFSAWIQSVIQAVKPFFSPNDIEKGTFWFSEIQEVLRDSHVGILFVTTDNKDRPWLIFEAGALAAKMGKSRVIPLLFQLQPADLVGPLPNLNAAVFSKDEIKKVVTTINGQLGEFKIDANVLTGVFEKWWPDLERDIMQVLEGSDDTPPGRGSEDMLQELLLISRSTQDQLFILESRIHDLQHRGMSRSRMAIGWVAGAVGRDRFASMLEDLPSDVRDAVILTDLEGVTQQRASEILGCSLGRLREMLEYGRHKILKAEYDSHSSPVAADE